MIEDLSKKKHQFLILSTFLALICAIDEERVANENYISSAHLICKDICVDIYIDKNPYIGLNFKAAHNFSLSGKTSLMNSDDGSNYYHHLYGFDLDFFSSNKYDFGLSFDINKSIYNSNQKYSWQQFGLSYFKKNKNTSLQIMIGILYDNAWQSNYADFIYGIKIKQNIFLNIGLIRISSDLNHEYKGFLGLNFNI